jgi:hypothetical protein
MTDVQLFRHKPTVVRAVQYTGGNPDVILAFAGVYAYTELGKVVVKTPNMDLILAPGDWVIEGQLGEFYPVPQSILDANYEALGAWS